MDAEVATAFQRGLTEQGMIFKMGTKVTSAKAAKDGVVLTLEPAAGGATETLTGDVVLVAIGRSVPDLRAWASRASGSRPTSAASSTTTTSRPARTASGSSAT